MTQKIFLTSALAMGVIAPAIAEPSNTGSFPNDGYMQEDYTYTKAATEENMGVYEGSVNATAEYTDDLYNIVAGNYLAAGSEDENGTQCPTGSYCPGLTNATYDEDNDQGINSCPSEYGLSAAGSDSQNDCYRTCTNADVEHSTGTMNGGYYYGNNNQCEPTDCVNGWHMKSEKNLGDKFVNNPTVLGYALASASGQYKENSGLSGSGVTTHGKNFYGIEDNDTRKWGLYYKDPYADVEGVLVGHALCSTQPGGDKGEAATVSNLVEESGSNAQHCYCKVNEYRNTKRGTVESFANSPWIYGGNTYYDNCIGCEEDCYKLFGANKNMWTERQRAFNAVKTLATCEANTITINWSDAAQTDIDVNNAGTATYGEDVRTPVKAATKKGQTFRGWRFSKPEQTNLP